MIDLHSIISQKSIGSDLLFIFSSPIQRAVPFKFQWIAINHFIGWFDPSIEPWIKVLLINDNVDLISNFEKVLRAEAMGGLSPPVTFGHSLSGGMDLDGNDYPDLVVGAYDDSRVYLIRSRPIIGILTRVELKDNLTDIDPNGRGCEKYPNITEVWYWPICSSCHSFRVTWWIQSVTFRCNSTVNPIGSNWIGPNAIEFDGLTLTSLSNFEANGNELGLMMDCLSWCCSFTFNACFQMDSMEDLSGNLELKYRIEAETFDGRKFSRVRFDNGLENKSHVVEKNIQLLGLDISDQCFEETVFIKVSIHHQLLQLWFVTTDWLSIHSVQRSSFPIELKISSPCSLNQYIDYKFEATVLQNKQGIQEEETQDN